MEDPVLFTAEVKEAVDGCRVVVLSGELDFNTTEKLLKVVRPEVSAGHDVVLDMGQVTFCDSGGLNSLVRLHKAAQAAGGSLALARVSDRVGRVLAIVSLDRILKVVADVPMSGGPR